MKVILMQKIERLGEPGQQVDVADGYARNFLLPKKLALTATAGNLTNLDHIRKQQESKADRIRGEAEALRQRIEALTYEERRQASEEGKLFGSVTSQDVVEFLEQNGLKIERRRVHLEEPIKALGETTVSIRLHPEVAAQLRVNVVRE